MEYTSALEFKISSQPPKNLMSQKLLSKTKPTDSISTAGNAAMTVLGTPCGTALTDPITTPISIRLLRSG